MIWIDLNGTYSCPGKRQRNPLKTRTLFSKYSAFFRVLPWILWPINHRSGRFPLGKRLSAQTTIYITRKSPGRKENTLERRIYFLAGDVLSNTVTGMAAAWLASVMVAPSWSIPAGMFAGMLAGMGPGLLLMPVFVGLFGAMEVMLPVMLTAMLAGMVYGMASAMQVPPAPAVLLGGGSIGLLVLLLTYAVDTSLHGRRL
jgi:ABC-type multidrug transport system permease subunit